MKKIRIPMLVTSFVPLTFVLSCSNENEKLEQTNMFLFSESQKVLLETPVFDNKVKIEELIVINNESTKQEAIDLNKSFIFNNKFYLSLDRKFEIGEKLNFNVLSINNNYKMTISENRLKTFQKDDFQYKKSLFMKLIKDMSTNNIPSIILTRNASLVYQQAFYISLVNYFNNLSSNNSNNKNITIMSLENSGFEEKRFNFDFLKDKKIWNGIKDINKINSSNVQNFNLIGDSKIFSSPSENIKYLKTIMKKFEIENMKIDFVMPDLNLADWIRQFKKGNKKVLNFLIKNANRIIAISDGAAYTNETVPFLESELKDFVPKPREEVIKKLKAFQKGETNSLSIDDVYNFLLLKNFESSNTNSNFDFITFVHYDTNIKNASMLRDNNMYNQLSFSTNFIEYQELVDDKNRKPFLEAYSNLFVDGRLSMKDVFISGLNSYDPEKRNAIFLGSSLFVPLSYKVTKEEFSRLQHFEKLRKVVQDTFETFLKKFPPSEYNIIFKLHPKFLDENDNLNSIPLNYIKLISNNKIENPIIINPSIPIETLIANDYYLYKYPNNQDGKIFNFIFRENEKYKPYEWTTFFGFQATTTTIHTTRLFYQSTFNLSESEVAKLIPFTNFPIPKKFPIVDRLSKDIRESDNYYEDNLKKIKRIYNYYVPSIKWNRPELEVYDSIKLNFSEEIN